MNETAYQYHKDDLNRLLAELQANPPKEVDVESMGGYNNIISKYMLARAGLMHRSYELAISADSCIENNQIVSSTLLIRGLFETVSVIGFAYYKILSFNKDKDMDKFNESISRILFGSRDESTDHTSINILSMIDKIDKDYPGYRFSYDRLSELCHPNFKGASLLYGTPIENEIVQYNSDFSTTSSHKLSNINDLCLCIDRLKYFTFKITDIIEEFVEIVNELEERE